MEAQAGALLVPVDLGEAMVDQVIYLLQKFNKLNQHVLTFFNGFFYQKLIIKINKIMQNSVFSGGYGGGYGGGSSGGLGGGKFD